MPPESFLLGQNDTVNDSSPEGHELNNINDTNERQKPSKESRSSMSDFVSRIGMALLGVCKYSSTWYM
jgi:hypothetical protein